MGYHKMAKTSRPKTCITDLETGEVIVREYTDNEMIEHEAYMAQNAKVKSDVEAKTSQKNALLEKLGITAEEAALLLS